MMDVYISKELVLKTLEKLKQEPYENDVIANSLITVANRTLDSAIEIISIIDPYMRIPENWKEEQDERRYVENLFALIVRIGMMSFTTAKWMKAIVLTELISFLKPMRCMLPVKDTIAFGNAEN